MNRTLFVQDLKAKREFIWHCSLQENIASFLNEKIGHAQWELTEELVEFDKGERVKVGDHEGVVDDVFRTPFLIRERKMIASQRSPIYRIKLGEGVAYITADQLAPKMKVLNAIKEALLDEDSKLVTNFFNALLSQADTYIAESVSLLRKRVENVFQGTNLKHVYESILYVLPESCIETEMGALTAVMRRRLIEKFYSSGILLTQVTAESGKLGLTERELTMWKAVLGDDWKSEFGYWIEEGFSPTEVETFIKLSRDPRECALIRSSPTLLADFQHG